MKIRLKTFNHFPETHSTQYRTGLHSPALLEEAVRDGHAVVRLPGGRGVVRTFTSTQSGEKCTLLFRVHPLPVNSAYHGNENDD